MRPRAVHWFWLFILRCIKSYSLDLSSQVDQSELLAGVTKREGRKQGKDRSEICEMHDLGHWLSHYDDFGAAKLPNIDGQLYPFRVTRTMASGWRQPIYDHGSHTLGFCDVSWSS